MKKSLSLLLAIALVFGVFASVVSAADPVTAQEKFDFLKSKGIFTGINANGDAGLDQNMTRAQFARVLGLLKGNNVDAAPAKQDFKDVPASHWAYQEIGAAFASNLMVGTGNGKFNPNGNIKVQDLAVALVKALGLTPVAGATVDGAQAYAGPYIKALQNAGFALPTNYQAAATRGILVVASFDAYVTLTVPATAAVTKTTQVGAKKITVEFNKAVDTTKATVAVKRGTNSVTVNGTSWNDAKTVLTIETASKLVAGKHDVTIGGVNATDLTASVDAVAEAVKTIDILSDVGVLVDGPDVDTTADDAIQVGYKVSNQFGENITSSVASSEFNTSSSGTLVTLTPATGTVKVDFGADQILGTSVSLTLIHVNSATVGSRVLKISNEAKVAEVSVSKLYNATNATLNADSTLTDFYLVVEGKDQYGNAVAAAKLSTDVLVTVSNPAVASVNGLASNLATFSTLNIDGTNKSVLQLNGGIQAGTSVVTLIPASTGKAVSFTVTVAEGLKADNVTFGEVDLVSANQGTVNVPVTVTDLNGNEIKNIALLNLGTSGANKGVNVTVSGAATGNFTQVDGKVVYQFTAPAAAGTVTLTAVSKNNKVAVKTITVNAQAVPTVISGLDADVKTLIWDEQTRTLGAANLKVEDQYGRVMTDGNFAATLNADGTAANGEFQVVVSSDASVTSAVYQTPGDDIIDNNSNTVVLQGKEKGSESIIFTLQKHNGTAWNNVAGSDLSISFRTVVQSEVTSYSVDEISKVYNHASYKKNVNVVGTTADGKKVDVPAGQFTMATNVGTTVTTATYQQIDASAVTFVAADNHEKKGTATVTINNTGDQIAKEYTVTDFAPAIAKLEIRNGATTSVTNLNLAFAASHDPYTIDDIAEYLWGEDQYGQDVAFNATTGQITFDDGSNATPTVLFSGVTNAAGVAPTITNNGLSNASITGLAAGDSLKVTVTSNGKSATVTVSLF